MTRKSEHEYFLGLAAEVSTRSHDQHTQHGCVLVKDGKIIGTGYNGFPKGMRDNELPLTRPEKYPWMIHSEINALHNRDVIRPYFTAYITGPPCFFCCRDLWQADCSQIIIPKDGIIARCIDEEQQQLKRVLFDHVDMRIYEWDSDNGLTDHHI